MPKRGAISLAITGIALVLLLNFKTPQTTGTLGTAGGGQAIISSPASTAQTNGGSTTGGSTTGGATTGGATAVSTPSTAANGGSTSGGSTSGGSTTTSTKSGTITGSSVDTPYGAVQLQVTFSNGKITNVQAVQYPSDNGHSLRISQYAIPTLIQETLQAQSAQIDAVSGATYTSQGYMQSLQSALDQAHA